MRGNLHGEAYSLPTESRNRAVDILIQEGKDYQVQLFHGVEHGFALRGNIDNAYERKSDSHALFKRL
jgi:hypothetical protein